MDLRLIFLVELCCRSNTGLLQFNLFWFVAQIADPTLAEMGKNLKEAMKMLEDSQRRTEEENGKKSSGDIPGPLQGR